MKLEEMSVERLGAELEEVKEDLARAAKHYELVLANLRKKCKHTFVSECEREHMEYVDDLPYERICETCGTKEVSEFGNWKILTTDRTRKVSREEVHSFMQYAIGVVSRATEE